jgi:hypothetical protein
MRETGRRLADGYLKEPPLLASTAISEFAPGSGIAGDEAQETREEFAANFPAAR